MINIELARTNMIEQQVRTSGGVRSQDVLELL